MTMMLKVVVLLLLAALTALLLFLAISFSPGVMSRRDYQYAERWNKNSTTTTMIRAGENDDDLDRILLQAQDRNLIVGGTPVEQGEFPYFAFSPLNQVGCGGTLIHEDIVLTAARCQRVFEGRGLWIGTTTLNVSDGEFFEDEVVLPHPDFDTQTQANDLMLIKLVGSSSTTPVTLNTDRDAPRDGANTVSIGLGATEDQGTVGSPVLLEVTIPTIANSVCEPYYSNRGVPVVERKQLCAGVVEGGRGTCRGDSGGPLLFRGVQVGLTSFGFGCAQPGVPGIIFTRITGYAGWIRDGICDLSDNPPRDCLPPAPTISPQPTEAEPTKAPSMTDEPTAAPDNPIDRCLLAVLTRPCHCGLFLEKGDPCPRKVIKNSPSCLGKKKKKNRMKMARSSEGIVRRRSLVGRLLSATSTINGQQPGVMPQQSSSRLNKEEKRKLKKKVIKRFKKFCKELLLENPINGGGLLPGRPPPGSGGGEESSSSDEEEEPPRTVNGRPIPPNPDHGAT